ncbi:MAG TPA: DUF3105 domain-containing protein [Chloroflexota bacterium]|nr:DUF3105 domain-containing protein [Chloroflexota bacterium]
MPVSTREERRQQRKQDRHEAQRRAARSANTRRNIGLGGLGAVVVAVAIVVVMLARRGGSGVDLNLPGTHFTDTKTASGQLYEHIPETEPVTTDPAGHYPPVFGNHYPIWRPPGAYDSPIPEGYFLHDLEHGGIVVLYNCPSGCDDAVNQLKSMVTSLPKEAQFGEVKFVVSPNTKISHQFAILAWDWELDMDQFDADTVRTFYHDHVDKGPEQAAI